MLQRVLVREWLRALPDVARLLWRLVRDDRVPKPIRAGLGAVLGYVVLPIDIVPDWIPIAGRIDDSLIAMVGIRALLRRVDEDLLLEHWSQNPAVLGKLIGKDFRSIRRQRLIHREQWRDGER